MGKAPTKVPTKAPTKAPAKAPTKALTKAPTASGCGKMGLGLGLMFRGCSNSGECCPSSGWNCGPDGKCGMFHVSLSCAQYTKIAEKVAQVVAGKGCTAAGIATCTAADVALGTTACQLAGIGPEDPASWICTIA